MKVTVIMWICLDCQLTCLLWIQSGSSRIQQDPVLSTGYHLPPLHSRKWLSLHQSAAEPVSNLVTTDTQNLRVGKPKHLVVQLQT